MLSLLPVPLFLVGLCAFCLYASPFCFHRHSFYRETNGVLVCFLFCFKGCLILVSTSVPRCKYFDNLPRSIASRLRLNKSRSPTLHGTRVVTLCVTAVQARNAILEI